MGDRVFAAWCLTAVALMMAGESAAQQLTSVPGIGVMPQAVSNDGLAVVGYFSPGPIEVAFRWTDAGGTQVLGALNPGSASRALAVSGDGTTVVGVAVALDGYRAGRCTAAERS